MTQQDQWLCAMAAGAIQLDVAPRFSRMVREACDLGGSKRTVGKGGEHYNNRCGGRDVKYESFVYVNHATDKVVVEDGGAMSKDEINVNVAARGRGRGPWPCTCRV